MWVGEDAATWHREVPDGHSPPGQGKAGQGLGLPARLRREGRTLSSLPFACWIWECILDVAQRAALIPRLGFV